MMIKIDEKGYYTGNYCSVGSIDGGIEGNPPEEQDSIRQLAYKLVEGNWVFDEARYDELINVKPEVVVDQVQQNKADITYLAMMMEVDL